MRTAWRVLTLAFLTLAHCAEDLTQPQHYTVHPTTLKPKLLFFLSSVLLRCHAPVPLHTFLRSHRLRNLNLENKKFTISQDYLASMVLIIFNMSSYFLNKTFNDMLSGIKIIVI